MQVNYQGIPAMLRIGAATEKALGVPDLVQEQVKT